MEYCDQCEKCGFSTDSLSFHRASGMEVCPFCYDDLYFEDWNEEYDESYEDYPEEYLDDEEF